MRLDHALQRPAFCPMTNPRHEPFGPIRQKQFCYLDCSTIRQIPYRCGLSNLLVASQLCSIFARSYRPQSWQILPSYSKRQNGLEQLRVIWLLSNCHFCRKTEPGHWMLPLACFRPPSMTVHRYAPDPTRRSSIAPYRFAKVGHSRPDLR